MVKTDFNGNEIWSRNYNANLSMWGWLRESSVIQANDGYILTGSKLVHAYTPYMARVDRDGNLIWSKMYNQSGNRYIMGEFNSAVPINGGYVFAGSAGRDHPGTYVQGFIAKADLDGNEIWNRLYPAPGALDIIQASHGLMGKDYMVPYSSFDKVLAAVDGYILAGEANDSIWVVKTDFDGNEIWNRTYGNGPIIAFVNATGGYAFLNNSHLVMIDTQGGVAWEHELKEYLPGSPDYLIKDMAATPGGYVMVGQINPLDNRSDQVYLMKTDLKGNLTWNTTYTMSGYVDVCNLVVDRGAYVISGIIMANITDNYGVPFLLKTRSDNTEATTAMPATGPALVALALIVTAIAAKRRK